MNPTLVAEAISWCKKSESGIALYVGEGEFPDFTELGVDRVGFADSPDERRLIFRSPSTMLFVERIREPGPGRATQLQRFQSWEFAKLWIEAPNSLTEVERSMLRSRVRNGIRPGRMTGMVYREDSEAHQHHITQRMLAFMRVRPDNKFIMLGIPPPAQEDDAAKLVSCLQSALDSKRPFRLVYLDEGEDDR